MTTESTRSRVGEIAATNMLVFRPDAEQTLGKDIATRLFRFVDTSQSRDPSCILDTLLLAGEIECAMSETWGIVPAAGRGTRIQPLAFSKELLPVGSRMDTHEERPKAVSEYLIDRMLTAGATRICFVVSPGKTDIMQYFGGKLAETAICYAVQQDPNGLCDALFTALPFIAPEDEVLIDAGGRALTELAQQFGARRVAPLYGSVDPATHRRVSNDPRFASDLSYLGTYSADRQLQLEELFVKPASCLPGKKFCLAGALFPAEFPWTTNTYWLGHIAPSEHPAFYSSSNLTLNVTRGAMAEIGYCPSGRLFEATACGDGCCQRLVGGTGLLFSSRSGNSDRWKFRRRHRGVKSGSRRTANYRDLCSAAGLGRTHGGTSRR